MKAPPLLSEHPARVQFGLAIVLPAAFGAVTGIFLGVAEPAYIVLSLLGIFGGIGAGFDHVNAKAGAKRGVLGGFLFGAFILIAHEIHGEPAEAHLPEPAVILVAITTVLGAAFGAIGGHLRARSLSREPVAEDQDDVEDAAREAVPPPRDPVASEQATPIASPLARPPAAPPPATSTPAFQAPAPPAPAPPFSTTPSAGGETPGSVSLNSGSFEDYRSIGMTVTQAKRIVDYRDRLGGFESVDQLDTIPGFSMTNLAELKPRLTI